MTKMRGCSKEEGARLFSTCCSEGGGGELARNKHICIHVYEACTYVYVCVFACVSKYIDMYIFMDAIVYPEL